MGKLLAKPKTSFWRFFHNLFLRSKVSSVPSAKIPGLEPILHKDPMTHVRSLAHRAICYIVDPEKQGF